MDQGLDLQTHHHRVTAFFSELCKKYGNSYEAVGWGSEETQTLRFSILKQVGAFHGASLLDV